MGGCARPALPVQLDAARFREGGQGPRPPYSGGVQNRYPYRVDPPQGAKRQKSRLSRSSTSDRPTAMPR